MRNLLSLLILVLSSTSLGYADTFELVASVGQSTIESKEHGPLDYSITHAKFLQAKSAKLYTKSDGTVAIQVEDLQEEVVTGAVITFQSELATSIVKVTTLIDFNGMQVGLYPAQNLRPNASNEYIITGEPGSKYGVLARITQDGEELEEQIYVQLEGKTQEPTPPVEDLSKITEAVKSSVGIINDPITQEVLKEYLEKLLEDFPTELDLAIAAFKNTVGDAFVEAMKKTDPPYKDWHNGFRMVVETEVTKLAPTTATQYKAAITAAVKGL